MGFQRHRTTHFPFSKLRIYLLTEHRTNTFLSNNKHINLQSKQILFPGPKTMQFLFTEHIM